MRSSLFLTVASFFTCALSLTFTAAQAQDVFASNAAHVSDNTDDSGTAPAVSTGKVVLTGKITNPAGVLPGAVVILTGTKQLAVTNADGEFEFVVPANAGALAAVVTYAGYADEQRTLNASADESTVNLADAPIIVVSRKQQLKKYLKTARKQVKHDLKRVYSNK